MITYNVIFGAMELSSPYLWKEGESSKPLVDMGITHNGRTETVNRALTDFGIEDSFARASKRFEEHYGFGLSASTVDRVTQATVLQAEDYLEEKLRKGRDRSIQGSEAKVKAAWRISLIASSRWESGNDGSNMSRPWSNFGFAPKMLTSALLKMKSKPPRLRIVPPPSVRRVQNVRLWFPGLEGRTICSNSWHPASLSRTHCKGVLRHPNDVPPWSLLVEAISSRPGTG